MKQFDIEKLDKAIIYAERMADGRVPYSNQPTENEVLNNPNVIRSMYFIKEVLEEVRANDGLVGRRARKEKVSVSAFPFEVLERFEYQSDKSIAYLLGQFKELADDPNTKIISAPKVNKWLETNGFITKAVVNDAGKECWIPTEKGEALGLTSESKGEPGREYILTIYTKPAQEFLASNLKRITEES